MRVAVIDAWGCSTSWSIRLAAEGADVRLWSDTSECPNGEVGKGLVTKETSYERLVAWAKEAPEEAVVLFCQSKYGKQADALRKDGLYVVGGGAFADKLEDDRQFGQDVAAACGMNIPAFCAFTSISDAIDAWKGHREGGVWKTDEYLESDATQVCKTGEDLVAYLRYIRTRYRDKVKCVVQELIGGRGSADFDLNSWWDGENFIRPYGLTLEHKRFMDGDLGPSTGCALNAFWAEEECAFAEEVHFDKLAEIFRSYEASPGIYAANYRISDDDGKAYFLEWTPRLGYDSEPTAALLVDSLSDFLWRVATKQGGTMVSPQLAYSVRLSVPPYPTEDVEDGRKSAKGLPIPDEIGDLISPPFLAYQIAKNDEEYEVASPEGIVGLACAVGDDLEAMGESCLDFIKEIHDSLSKLQARSDGVAVLRSDAEKLDALGIEIHPALLVGANQKPEVLNA